MARFTVTGTVLGLRQKPYDMPNEDGSRNKGVSTRLVIFDPDAVEAIELVVKPDQVGAFSHLGAGELVSVGVDVFANLRQGQALLSMTAVPPAPADAGKRSAA